MPKDWNMLLRKRDFNWALYFSNTACQQLVNLNKQGKINLEKNKEKKGIRGFIKKYLLF